MLIKDPMKRPSMRKILEKPFLAARITKLLTMTIAKNEFSNTFVTNHLNTDASSASIATQPQEGSKSRSQEEHKESRGAENSNSSDNASNVVVSKAKIVLNKDAGKRRKKLDVVQGSSSSTRQDESSVSTLKLQQCLMITLTDDRECRKLR